MKFSSGTLERECLTVVGQGYVELGGIHIVTTWMGMSGIRDAKVRPRGTNWFHHVCEELLGEVFRSSLDNTDLAV